MYADFAVVLLLMAFVRLVAQAQTQTPWPENLKIITWGALSNDPSWNQALNVRASRQGCSSSPASCIKNMQVIEKADGIKQIFLAIAFDPATAADYARQYSELSRNASWLREVGIDDFVGQYQKATATVGLAIAEPQLEHFVTNLKSGNLDLKFGITIYEDELNSPFLHGSQFPQRLRDRVDYVHLFIHYRMNGPAFASYVQDVRKLFPNARIIGGVYAYDRQDYLPCSPHDPKKCTSAQKSAMFAQTTKIEAQLLKMNVLDWLEITPSYFGREAEWGDWKNDPRSCMPNRHDECIQNTIALRRRMLSILQETAASR